MQNRISSRIITNDLNEPRTGCFSGRWEWIFPYSWNHNVHHVQEGGLGQRRATKWGSCPSVRRFEPVIFKSKRHDFIRLTTTDQPRWLDCVQATKELIEKTRNWNVQIFSTWVRLILWSTRIECTQWQFWDESELAHIGCHSKVITGSNPGHLGDRC